jgi:hypothetical protein
VRAAVSWFVRRIGRPPCCSPLTLSEREKCPIKVAERNEIPAGALRAAISNKSCCRQYQVAFAICDRHCLHYFSSTGPPPPTIFSKEHGVWWRCGLRSSHSFPWLVFFSFFLFFLGLARAIDTIPLLSLSFWRLIS